MLNTSMSFARSILCLLLIATGPVFAADNLAAGRERVDTFLRGLEGLQAQFHQTLTDRTGQVVDEATGELAVRRPNRFRWDYREPHQQVIVADGARISLYDTDLE